MMIIVKVINQRALAAAGAAAAGHPGNKKLQQQLSLVLARGLVQSSSKNQKVTSTNNQQLIPIARNISLRQCIGNGAVMDSSRRPRAMDSDVKLLYSMSSANQFVSTADLSLFEREPVQGGGTDSIGASPIEKRKKYYGQSFNETTTMSATATERRLVVLMSWLNAREKHIEKYRQYYLDKGFDVLNVKTSSLDILLPGRGTNKISKDFVRFMIDKDYSDVLLHGFSVGGFMYGQMLLDIDRQEAALRQKLYQSIRGVILDSVVFLEGVPVGVSRSMVANQFLAKIVEKLLEYYLVLARNFATKHYERVSNRLWTRPIQRPTLFFVSQSDKISSTELIDKILVLWRGMGMDAQSRVFPDGPHVQLFTRHNEQYVEHLEEFLKKIKLI